jgi:hypothetical protein
MKFEGQTLPHANWSVVPIPFLRRTGLGGRKDVDPPQKWNLKD